MSRHTLSALYALAALSVGLSVGACTNDATVSFSTTGAMSVEVEFGSGLAGGQRGLRAAKVPKTVDRLSFVVLDTSGSTLAETNLLAEPGAGELALAFEGGTFRIAGVPAGPNRTLLARAYLGASPDPTLDRALSHVGRLTGLTIRAGATTEIGTLTLNAVGLRIPEADNVPPDPPAAFQVDNDPAGNALTVSFETPPQTDVAGWLVSVGTASSARDLQAIQRGRQLRVGDLVAAGLRVVAVGTSFGQPESVSVQGLTNGIAYAVAGYTFDADAEAAPLNYSAPALRFALPTDTVGPDAVEMLTVTASGADHARIAFRAPPGPTPAGYQVRASPNPGALVAASFVDLPYLRPPATGSPSVEILQSFDALGVTSTTSFFVGVRAYDEVGNNSPIAVARYAGQLAARPRIDTVRPPFAIAQREVTIHGLGFGHRLGRVVLTTSGTVAETFVLDTSVWSDAEVVVRFPVNARSGTIQLITTAGSLATVYVPVIARIESELIRRCFPFTCSSNADRGPYPFEMLGAGAMDGSTTSAIYRECCDPAFSGGIERLFGLNNENRSYVRSTSMNRSTVIAGTYSAERDLFMFVASNGATSMTSGFLTANRSVPGASELAQSVGAGDADGVSVVILPGSTGPRVPAMIALSVGGVVRTASVTDARTERFNGFFRFSSPTESFDRVTMKHRSDNQLLMAYRAGRSSSGPYELAVRRSSTGRPSDFVEVSAATRPVVADRLEVLALPDQPGQLERFVIVYEAPRPDGGTDIRVLRAADYGQSLGYLPFPQDGQSRRLHDAGLVMREGRAWISIIATLPRLTRSHELLYTEVPGSALDDTATPSGQYPGVTLDTALNTTSGRLGCKPFPQNTCPIGWLGEGTNLLFLRR